MYFTTECHSNMTTGGVSMRAEGKEFLYITHGSGSSTHTKGGDFKAFIWTVLILASENSTRVAAVWDTSFLA